jgi:signal transduction histidine kinase/CheY-like chemotaxis protein/HAMP domain-containing protein
MRLSFRSKLLALSAATAVAFALLILESERTASQVNVQLENIEQRHLPRLLIGPQLTAGLERLHRGFQDAVAAQDLETLALTKTAKEKLLLELTRAKDTLDPAEVALLQTEIETYYQTAAEVSKRLVAGETGEALVEAMGKMQVQHGDVQEHLDQTTRFDAAELGAAFEALRQAERSGTKTRLVINVFSFLFVFALSLLMSRSVMRTVRALYDGLARFGRGQFDQPIEVLSADELGEVARRANQMAESLRLANLERDAADWQKSGQARLAAELQKELELQDTGRLAVTLIARHADAIAAALYIENDETQLELLADYALSGASHATTPMLAFRRGEGLVGQAAEQTELLIIDDPPHDYLRIRSGLGESHARAIVFLPIVHLGKVTGVLELAFLKARTSAIDEFLLSIRDILAVALDLAKTRKVRRELLQETQRQAEQLRAQEEELRLNNDELQGQQEELRTKHEVLLHQTEELEVQGRLLEERNHDLEEIRRTLQDKARELEKVSAFKSQFLSNMSHELRTPLNSMLLLSSMLGENEGGNLTEKQVEFANTILSAGRDLLALINQVLDLAKIEAGKQTVNVEPVVLADVAANMTRVHGPVAKNKAIQFRVQLDPQAPAQITSDRRLLDQILTNLLGNAIKFTERGEVVLKIAPGRPGSVSLSVTDSGIGIPAEHQKRIFAPFEQVDGKTERRYGGTGLGLAIVRELTVLLGGELDLVSAPNQGSTFKVTLPEKSKGEGSVVVESLPRRQSEQTDIHSPQELPPVQGAEASRGPLLLIEDDMVFADRVAEIAATNGFHVLIAKTGASGLALAERHRPRGIILDIRLPDIDGFEVMNRLRSNPATRAIPVHFISAMDVREQGISMGAVGYLTKPITKGDLKAALEVLAPPSSPGHVLIFEGTRDFGDSVTELLAQAKIETQRVRTEEEVMQALDTERYACLILDLALPDTDALALLEHLHEHPDLRIPPVIVYTDRALSREEVQRLEAYTESVVVREGKSSERLLEEARLFVNQLKAGARAPRPGMLAGVSSRDINLRGRKLLVADDDMRTVYALSAMLRAKGAEVLVADTGKAAVAMLNDNPEVHAVLMDIMMPEMDGYEAMRRIRAVARFSELPIIALTAKAMKGDRAKCIEAGASDYLSKPIDGDRLLSMLHAWLTSGDANEQERRE